MGDEAVEFASLLCSRLCHDLMGPVGSIGNGLEMLADERDEALRGDYLQLVGDAQRAAVSRLQFFRLAFGAGAGFGDAIPTAELRTAVEALAAGHKRVELGWLVDQPAVPRGAARLLLNLLLIALDALARGGRLDVGVEGAEVVVRAEGMRLTLDPQIRAVLAGAADGPPDARTAPAWLVRRVAEAAGGAVQLADEEPGLLLLAASAPGGAPT